MKFSLLILLIVLTNSIFAQGKPDSLQMQIVEFPEIEAEFPGGYKALMNYISQNMTWPADFVTTDFAGKIYVSFYVNVDGTVSDAKTERGLNEKLDEIAIKLVLGMPKWKPAETDGKPVRSQIMLPIFINLK